MAGALAITLATGACVQMPPPGPSRPQTFAASCRTASATIAFDFEGASRSRCSVVGEREFAVLISPEHAPPINPSPWYAFRYAATGDRKVTVQLRYLGAWHRYAPVIDSDPQGRHAEVTLSSDGTSATLVLPPGAGVVSAQEIIDGARYRDSLRRWSRVAGGEVLRLGHSLEGRGIEAVRIGQAEAPHLLVLLGRQHPPEVTGAIAMESFVDRIADRMREDPALGARYQFLVVPLLNPDGVANGNWRANSGATDLNRDWGPFAQPETRAVAEWLGTLPRGVAPVAMIDFHSTNRNLFYVQGDEADAAGRRFLQSWLAGRESEVPGYAFAIEPRNANPGSGTAKNWFQRTYGVPSYTYEVADDADRAATRTAASAFAGTLFPALDVFVAARGEE